MVDSAEMGEYVRRIEMIYHFATDKIIRPK